MKAYTAPSVLYDDYNPDEKVSVSPVVVAVQPAAHGYGWYETQVGQVDLDGTRGFLELFE